MFLNWFTSNMFYDLYEFRLARKVATANNVLPAGEPSH